MNIEGVDEWTNTQPDQYLTAIHEGAHCVIANLLAGYPGASGIKLFPSNPDDATNWRGYCEILEFRDGWSHEPDVSMAWADMLVGFAGPASSLKLEWGVSPLVNCREMTPTNVREHWTGYGGDEVHCAALASAYWPREHFDTVMDAAAQVASDLVCDETIWRCIVAVGDYVVARRSASATEIELLVHRFIQDPFPAPRLGWALGLAQK